MEFSDIALAKLLQTQPELGQLILTFQDVSDEITDDSGIQVGVFVLRSAADLFYVPVDPKQTTFTLSTVSSSIVVRSSSL